MFVRKEVWKAYPFDEKMLTGFHCYDVDFSLQIAVSKRYRNYVCCSPEVQVEHLSEGNYNRNWCQDTVRMYNRKWNVILPIKIDDLCLTKREMERYREKSFNRFLQKSFKVDFPEKKEVLKIAFHRLLDSVPKRLLTVPVSVTASLLIALPIFFFCDFSSFDIFFFFSLAHCITV